MVFDIVVEMWIMVWLVIYPDRITKIYKAIILEIKVQNHVTMYGPQLRKIWLLFILYKEQIQEHQIIVEDVMQNNTEHPNN